MPYAPTCHPQKTIGLVDIKIASPFNGTLLPLGTATDYINPEERVYYHNVPGDRNGGREGPPIEIQDLGRIVTVNFSLTSFTQANVDIVRARAATTLGVMTQAEVGQFILGSKAFRLLLDTPAAEDVRNYWCAIAREPIGVGLGTKYAEWVMSFECHRPPCGHPKTDILWDLNRDAFA